MTHQHLLAAGIFVLFEELHDLVDGQKADPFLRIDILLKK